MDKFSIKITAAKEYLAKISYKNWIVKSGIISQS